MAFYLGLAGKLGNEPCDTRQEEEEGHTALSSVSPGIVWPDLGDKKKVGLGTQARVLAHYP